MASVVHKNKCHPIRDKENQFVCSECSKSFEFKPKMLTHIRIDHFNFHPFACSKCPKSFDTGTRLSAHFKLNHATELKFKCDSCDERFKSTGRLYFHKRMKHENIEFVCEHCAKSFKFQGTLNEHVKYTHTEKANKPIICEECGIVSKNEKAAKSHAKYHREKPSEPIKCPYEGCNKIFAWEKLKNKHVSYVHLGLEKKYPCKFCGLKFAIPSLAKKHEQKVHLGIKNLKCDKCDFTTKYIAHLNGHKKSIHGGASFSCNFPGCSKSYNRKDNLDCHRKTAHQIPRPKEKEKM